MSKTPYTAKSVAMAVVSVAIILPSSLILAYLVGHGYLEVDLGIIQLSPGIIVGAGLVLSLLSFAFISIALGISEDARLQQWHQGQPAPPPSGILTRMVRHDPSGREFLISGRPEQTPGELLRNNWPFETPYRGSNWRVLDENDNDVTSEALFWCNGSLSIRFD